jgi:hypothetical protein
MARWHCESGELQGRRDNPAIVAYICTNEHKCVKSHSRKCAYVADCMPWRVEQVEAAVTKVVKGVEPANPKLWCPVEQDRDERSVLVCALKNWRWQLENRNDAQTCGKREEGRVTGTGVGVGAGALILWSDKRW